MNILRISKSGRNRGGFIKTMAMIVSRSKLEVLVLIMSVVLVIGFSTIVYRVVSEVSIADKLPAHLVRLQVIEANGNEELLSEGTKKIFNFITSELEIKIVETKRIYIRDVPKSFVISRQEDKTAARLLALQLNLNDDDVIYMPLDNNLKQISATLVIGTDFDLGNLPTFIKRES